MGQVGGRVDGAQAVSVLKVAWMPVGRLLEAAQCRWSGRVCRSMGWYSGHRWPHLDGAIRRQISSAVLGGGWEGDVRLLLGGRASDGERRLTLMIPGLWREEGETGVLVHVPI